MNTTIYVDNLAVATTESELIELFSRYGGVTNVNIAVDSTSDEPCCFGFVTMVTQEGALAAIQALNGRAQGTAALSVTEAWPSQKPTGRKHAQNPRQRHSTLF